VTRNRTTTYTKAINSTNPDMIQIADKWHFLIETTGLSIEEVKELIKEQS